MGCVCVLCWSVISYFISLSLSFSTNSIEIKIVPISQGYCVDYIKHYM